MMDAVYLHDLWYALVRNAIFGAEIFLALWLCLRDQPRREGYIRRLAVIIVLAAAGLVATAMVGSIGGENSLYRANDALVSYLSLVCVLLAGTAAVRALFDLPTMSALFCCVAAYTMQSLAASLEGLVWRLLDVLGVALSGNLNILVSAMTSAVVAYVACYFIFLRRVENLEISRFDDHRVLALFGAVLVMVLGLDALIRFYEASPLREAAATLLLRGLHIVICAFVLAMEYELAFSRQLRVEAATFMHLMTERTRQYEASQETIDAINVKCHDMRHQIRTLAQRGGIVDATVLSDMERQISVYDSAVRTGNDALDTILTEKSLTCQSEGITLSCIADGAALSFMSSAEIYSLFGNALDNAMEAVMQIADEGRRSISLNVRTYHGLVNVSVENFCEGEPAFRDGLPISTRGAGHGFGMRSMELIAKRYGGELSARAEDGVFWLNVLLPQPEE